MRLKRLDFKCNRMSLEVLSRGAGFKALGSSYRKWVVRKKDWKPEAIANFRGEMRMV